MQYSSSEHNKYVQPQKGRAKSKFCNPSSNANKARRNSANPDRSSPDEDQQEGQQIDKDFNLEPRGLIPNSEGNREEDEEEEKEGFFNMKSKTVKIKKNMRQGVGTDGCEMEEGGLDRKKPQVAK